MPRKDVHEAIDAQVLVEPLANELGIVVGITIQKRICIHVVRNKDQQHDGEDVVSLVLKDLKALLEDVAVEVLVKNVAGNVPEDSAAEHVLMEGHTEHVIVEVLATEALVEDVVNEAPVEHMAKKVVELLVGNPAKDVNKHVLQ